MLKVWGFPDGLVDSLFESGKNKISQSQTRRKHFSAFECILHYTLLFLQPGRKSTYIENSVLFVCLFPAISVCITDITSSHRLHFSLNKQILKLQTDGKMLTFTKKQEIQRIESNTQQLCANLCVSKEVWNANTTSQ